MAGILPAGKLAKLGKVGFEIADAGIDATRAATTAARACSFTGATVVLMANGSKKPIEDVEVGDEVMASDPETGEQEPRKVTHVFVHEDAVSDLVLDDGSKLGTTEDHPFWSVTDARFERADQLAAGEQVLTADGRKLDVVGLALESTRQALAYNLSIDGIHTYHVGEHELLVHNTCPVGATFGPAMSRDNLMTSFRNLTPGENPKSVRTVASVDELRGVFGSWTAGAERLAPRGPKIPEVYRLPDGTEVQWRLTSKSGGETIDVIPTGGQRKRVHLE